MSLIDATQFFQENDVFLLRYKELSPHVDKFIVLEARETHRGQRKPLTFAHAHLEKVEYHVLDHYPQIGNDDNAASARDWYARDYITHLLGAQSDDWCMISDMDEIPNLTWMPFVYANAHVSTQVYAFEQYLSYYYVNWRADYKWYGTKLAQRKSFNLLGDLRRMHKDQCAVIPNGGWHMSYLGGVDYIQNKLQAFCHADMVKDANDIENILFSMARGVDLFGRGETFTPQYIDATYPKHIMEFPQFIGPVL
jgi:beta-1,4-mannosyl-glycoprotein beta-1,4-N-acetylglucosaminyltransferase